MAQEQTLPMPIPHGLTPRQKFQWVMPEPPPQDGCWDWRGHLQGNGYGWINSRVYGSVYAHRVSHDIFNGPVPPGLHVLHSCDRPICVQPRHLSAGTHAQNMREALERGRVSRRGPKPSLNDEQVAEILASPLSTYKLAPVYGVSYQTIWHARAGKGAYARQPSSPEAA